MYKCLETNKVCSEYNRKCKVCALDNPKKVFDMTDYEIMMKEKKAKEIFENAIPEECRKCTILERDYLHKKVKCLYRSNDRCMLDKLKKD